MSMSLYVHPSTVFPVLNVRKLGSAGFDRQQQSNRFEGFAGDRDYVELPEGVTADVEYFNSAGVSQWTVVRSDLHANVDDWVGFTLDGSLVYLVGVDEGTTPDTFYLASVDAAGTVINIGNGQPGSDFSSTGVDWWSVVGGAAGSTGIQRNAVGDGNILVRQRQTAGTEEMEINISTGAIVADPAVISSDFSTRGGHKTADGIYCGFSAGVISLWTAARGIAYLSVDVAVGDSMGHPDWAAIAKMVVWKTEVYGFQPGSTAGMMQPRIWLQTDFDTWVKKIYEDVAGLTL